MTALDTKIIPKVFNLVAKYGKVVTFNSRSGYTYDETEGTATSTITSYSKKVTPPDKYDVRYVDGDLIRVGDSRIFLPAQGLEFTPARGESVIVDSESWTIIKANPIYSGDLVCLWELQLRG